MSTSIANELTSQVQSKPFIWMFLDYDGTLVDFAPTPDTVVPNPQITDLLKLLASKPAIRLAIISGRRLADVQRLIPVPGICLAGTYGVELLTPSGESIQRARYEDIRPVLESIKTKWVQITGGETGFFIEDKGWALALHARFSKDEDAKRVLTLAREIIDRELPGEHFRILGGHKFLEAAPLLAHKGETVSYLLDKYPWPGSQLLYIGDDDKDEEAFGVIQAHGGIAVRVINDKQMPLPTRANYTLDSPAIVNAWLEALLTGL